ncbi:MAG: FAD-binding protein [Ruminiclostridium sp.]|nr:FAD-binding protein [Ruminiclostridium sp.]
MRVINIVGAGLAGLSAALTLAEKGIRSRLISVQYSERAQSVLAEGGINAALDTAGEDDTPELHFEETMRAGELLADPEAVRALTGSSPDIVRRLAELGVPFSREPDGSLALRGSGGQKKKRTAFVRGGTGKMIMTSLIDAVRRYEADDIVERLPHHTMIRLLIRNGKCAGVRVRDDFSGILRDLAGNVILASGGLNGFFPGLTTGSSSNSGMAAAVLFTQGVKLANLEMIQYCPVTFAIPGKRCPVSAEALAAGGRLFSLRDGRRRYFMEEKYPVLKNLMPRDVTAREICSEIRSGAETFLDMTGIPAASWEERFSDLRAGLMRGMRLDPAEKPIPVEPGIHYFMGGIYVNARHETSMPGLYAAGECACIYHGANLLGGNAVPGAIYGGMTAARSASGYKDDPRLTDGVCRSRDELDCAPSDAFSASLCYILSEGLGIVRNDSGIRAALDSTQMLDCANEAERAKKALAEAMLYSALGRMESRGAHYREDFPETFGGFRSTTVAVYSGGAVRITFDDTGRKDGG